MKSLGVVLLCFLSLMAGGVLAQSSVTVHVQNTVDGTTPAALGYNLGHFMEGSNAADWWRYNGIGNARAFISASDIEPVDDNGNPGDGVGSAEQFFARRAALRANASNAAVALDSQYVVWSAFASSYQNALGDTNRFRIAHAFTRLREQGTEILANITASPSRFPVASDSDWANKWELWQHYYAQAFHLAATYDVRRFSMFNEPNNWTGMTPTDWYLRLRICSDAIQSAIADVNARYGKALTAQIYAPNTANGETKYLEWGQTAVQNRHLRIDGVVDAAWMNLHVYNYQKYSMYTNDTGTSSGYIEDILALGNRIAGDMSGEVTLPVALTEYNVRTGLSYDGRSDTLDSPADYSALGANSVALARNGARALYLFKFAQTERTGGTYPVAKNGTHYAENATTGLNNYGGATKGAEVYRLFNKAARDGRPRYAFSSTGNADFWPMVTRDETTRTWFVFAANKGTSALNLSLNLSSLGIPEGNRFFIEEVSQSHSGAVSIVGQLASGSLSAVMPAQSVWLVTIPGDSQAASAITVGEDTELRDGVGKNTPGGGSTSLGARSDGVIANRRASLLKFSLGGVDLGAVQRVLLRVRAGAISAETVAQVHVYGSAQDDWTEGAATWAGLPSVLRQNVPGGSKIVNNVVASQGTVNHLLGQLVVSSATATDRYMDVTDFVRSQTDGTASFLITQDHRWDIAIPSLTSGDVQPDGVKVDSRESGSPASLVFWTRASTTNPPSILQQPNSITVNEGANASFSVTATGSAPLAYQWLFNGSPISGATTSSYSIGTAGVASAGAYSVTISNSVGAVTSSAATLTINRLPVAVASASPGSGSAPLTVNFTGSNSSDPEGAALAFLWAFGNGVSATTANASTTFSSAGTYNVMLRVTDPAGAFSTASVPVVVATAAKTVSVRSMTISLSTSTKGTTAKAVVTVYGSDGLPRASASVSGSWSGVVSGSSSGSTNRNGQVTLSSPVTKSRGTFTFTVGNIVASGYTYNPAGNSRSSISISN